LEKWEQLAGPNLEAIGLEQLHWFQVVLVLGLAKLKAKLAEAITLYHYYSIAEHMG